MANNDGSVTATPGADNVEQQIKFTDESGAKQIITATKDENGDWSLDQTPTDVSIDPETGVVTLAPDAVEDGSEVTSTGSDQYGNPESDSAKALDTKAPEINDQVISYDENQVPVEEGDSVIVGKVSATDNIGITAYTITGGNEQRYFDVDQTGNIVLTAAGLAAAANDFESVPNEFKLTVQVKDAAGFSSEATVTLQVQDVEEAVGPVTDNDVSENLVTEKAEKGTEVGITALATDPDTKDSVTYSLSDDANGLFSIDAQTGVVTLAGELDYATARSHTITVQAISTDDTTSEQDFTINVAENNPANVTDAQGSVTEDAATTTISGKVTVTDLDEGQAFAEPQTKQGTYGTFSVDENGNWSYALDNDKPEVQSLREGAVVEDTFSVTSKDGSGTGTVTITIIGTNDVASIDGTVTGAVTEDAAETTASGKVTVTDPDTGEAVVEPQTDVQGKYGSFSITADGEWIYTLDNSLDATNALTAGQVKTEKFEIVSKDHTAVRPSR